ncbi:MAG: 1-deoxy-D-xylulose-5-phosphate synthase N-terminal domain-containing protein [Ilumatobacteraceae bacterium]
MDLSRIRQPADLRTLSTSELGELAGEIRDFIVRAVAETGGHLGSNLGAVELTLALHRVFDSPTDAILWDTGHQAYVHKIVTGRQTGFERLRQAGGLSGYPSREESPHDFIENSHASTVLSYAYGMSVARGAGTDHHRHIVAVIGDGSLTGGMAYEALNNIGHSRQPRHHRPQRQRAQLRADDLQPGGGAGGRRFGHGRSSEPAATDHHPPVTEPDVHPPEPGVRAPPAQAGALHP